MSRTQYTGTEQTPALTVDPASRVQQLLAEARILLVTAGGIAEEANLGDQMFMGMVFEPHFGWISQGGDLIEESAWNHSACTIHSRYARGYGMEGWKDMGSDSWKLNDE